MYKLNIKPSFEKAYKKLVKKDEELKKKIRKILEIMSDNPKYPSLKSHKVQPPDFGVCWSSWVTGDIRLIWNFDEEDNLVILVLDIGGHSGGGKVYK